MKKSKSKQTHNYKVTVVPAKTVRLDNFNFKLTTIPAKTVRFDNVKMVVRDPAEDSPKSRYVKSTHLMSHEELATFHMEQELDRIKHAISTVLKTAESLDRRDEIAALLVAHAQTTRTKKL